MTPARPAPDRTALRPAPAVAMGEVLTGLEPVVVEPPAPGLPVPMGALGARVVAVPLDHTGVVGTAAAVLVVLHEVEVVVVRGLVMVQGQSVIVRVVAWRCYLLAACSYSFYRYEQIIRLPTLASWSVLDIPSPFRDKRTSVMV